MTTVRVSLAEQLETRDGSTSKDELPTNCFVDGSPNHKYVTKRFGTSLSVALGAGTGQGMFHLGNDNYAIKGDSLYRLSDSHNFTYTAPTTSNLQYQSITQPDNTKTIFKNTTNGYIFDGTTVSQIANNGGVSSITMTNNGWGGTVSPTITAGSFVTNTWYTILTVGTTDFTLIGATSNTVGVVFKATGAGSGTGTATQNFNLIFTGGSGSGAAGTFTVAPGTVSNTIAFTTRTLPSSANWSAIAFSSTLGTGQGRFCAIASGGTTAATSDDGGLTWTARTLPVSANWSSIAWSGTVFCAVANNGGIGATSPDGITWTQRTLPNGITRMGRAIYLPYSSIAWSSTLSLFCAVTSFTTKYPLVANDANQTYFATSPDGITWTQLAFSSPQNYSSIAWNGSVFCAVVYGSNIASTSTDGITWTQQTLPSTANWSAITWNGTLFCAVAYNSNIVATSPNGVAWTQQTLPASSLWDAISWNGALFCAISSFSGLAATSPDGATWTQTAESTTESWSAVASNTATGLIVGVASGTNHAMTGIAGVSSGSVVTTTITNTGSGYASSAPSVSFANCTGLTGATGIVNISSFPVTTVPGIAYLDGTYYVMEAGTNKIYGSGTTNAVLDNPAVWTPLNVVVANSVSGNGVAIARYYNYIVAFKSESIEYFYDAAGVLPNSPLAAVTNSVSRVGCASGTIVPIDNTIVFLSKSIQRGIQVSMLDGQSSVVISTPDVDRILNATNILGNSIYAFAIKIQGHSFYILTLKEANITIAYDMVTKGWFKVTLMTTGVTTGFPKAITTLTSANGIATAISTNHGFSDGDPIVISGAIQTAYDGNFNISYVDANTFTYPVSGNPVSPAIQNNLSVTSYNSSGNSPWGAVFDTTNNAIWVTNLASNNVTKFNADTGSVIGTYSVGGGPTFLCFDQTNNAIWVSNTAGGNSITKLNASTGATIATYTGYNSPWGIAYDPTNNAVWFANFTNLVTKLNASTGAVIGTYSAGSGVHGLTFDVTNNAVWVTNTNSNNVTKLNASNGSVIGTYSVGTTPQFIDFDISNNAIWVTNIGSNNVTKLNASTGAVIGTYSGLSSPYGVAFDVTNNCVWVNISGSLVARLDATTGSLINTYSIPNNGTGICFDAKNNSVYVSANVSPPNQIYRLSVNSITATPYVEGYFAITNYLNNGSLDLLQHESDGDIYYASTSVYQDQGSPINVKIRTKLIDGGSTHKKHISKIEVIGDKVNTTSYVRYTDDDYQTFCGYRPVYMNQNRSMIRRCGSTRRRGIELRHTDNTTFRVEGLELDIDKSNE